MSELSPGNSFGESLVMETMDSGLLLSPANVDNNPAQTQGIFHS